MKIILLSLLVLSVIVPLSFAASDCAHTCCRTYDGSWDDDFDDCRSPKTGYDSCVSTCEANVYANRPQMGDTSNYPTTVVHCCGSPFILATVLAGAAFVMKKK
jgi:hypothetical protein